MKNLFFSSVFFCSISIGGAQINYSFEIAPYVEFIQQHQNKSAKDYILDLFETHDIVAICERHHSDTTQYDFYLDLIGDPRFIKNVGNVVTESLCFSVNEAGNNFVHATNLSEKAIRDSMRYIFLNGDYLGFWDRRNFYQYMTGIYKINQNLISDEKINILFPDIPFSWSDFKTAGQYKAFMDLASLGCVRDSVMASYTMEYFDKIQFQKRKKMLIIWNYPHAFNDIFSDPSGHLSAFGILSERYGYRACNVLMNSTRHHNNGMPFSDGKWDAAFKVCDFPSIGFSFENTVFGKDSFDMYGLYNNKKCLYQDVFTGFIFYADPNVHCCVESIPQIVDSAFIEEMYKMDTLARPELKIYDKKEMIEELNAYLKNYRFVSCFGDGRLSPNSSEPNRQQYNEAVNKWLKK
jgi:hypothetical protein